MGIHAMHLLLAMLLNHWMNLATTTVDEFATNPVSQRNHRGIQIRFRLWLLFNVAQANKQRGIKKHLASHKLDQYIAVDICG